LYTVTLIQFLTSRSFQHLLNMVNDFPKRLTNEESNRSNQTNNTSAVNVPSLV